MERHQPNFLKLNFPGDTLNNPGPKSKHHAQEQIDQIIHILYHWDKKEDALTVEERKKGYKYVDNYQLEYSKDKDDENVHVVHLMRKVFKRKKKGQAASSHAEYDLHQVVATKDIFDVIYECHREAGQMKTGTSFNCIVEHSSYGITRIDVVNFIATCPVCLGGSVRFPKVDGAKQPITSSFFRDRFQCDLVDFRNNVGYGCDRTEYKWLLVVKDHFTRFVQLHPLSTKCEEEVASVLTNMI